jgi:hypothetical protein
MIESGTRAFMAPRNAWYVDGTMTRVMAMRSARAYADRHQVAQTVHDHLPGQDCEESCQKVHPR